MVRKITQNPEQVLNFERKPVRMMTSEEMAKFLPGSDEDQKLYNLGGIGESTEMYSLWLDLGMVITIRNVLL